MLTESDIMKSCIQILQNLDSEGRSLKDLHKKEQRTGEIEY